MDDQNQKQRVEGAAQARAPWLPMPEDAIVGGTLKPIRQGHPRFHKFCQEMSDLHERKNHDYASGGRALGNFERVAAWARQFPKMDWATREGVCILYMMKQLDAYMWLKSQGHKSKTGEGLLERLFDVGVYDGILYSMESDNLFGEGNNL